MRKIFILCAITLGACADSRTPLTAGLACAGQRSSFTAYADCARPNLGGGSQNDAYRAFLDYAQAEIAAGRATDAQAFATDLQAKQLVAMGLQARADAQRERIASGLSNMGNSMVAIGSAPARLTVTCTRTGNTVTCY